MASAVGHVDQDRYVIAVAEVVSALIKAYELQVPINLTKIKTEMSKKHKYVIFVNCYYNVMLKIDCLIFRS